LAGILAVLRFPDPADPQGGRQSATEEAAARLEELERERPKGPWERTAVLVGHGGAVALSAAAGGDPPPNAGGADRNRNRKLDQRITDLGWVAGCTAETGSALQAVVASGPARGALARMAGGRMADEPALLPYPYAALSWDGEEVVAELDELGAWPLYYRWLTPSTLAVATAALPLARLAPVARFDPEAVVEALTFGQVIGKRSLFGGVSALPPGARARFRRMETRIERTLPPDRPLARRSIEQAADEIHQALAVAVATTLAASPPGTPAVLLSGGLDSRLVLAHLTQAGAEPHAFTFGTNAAADVQLARAVTAELRTPHTVHDWTPAAFTAILPAAIALTDGQVPAHHVHGTDLLPELRRQAGAEWNGFAGDAILGGSFAHPRYGLPGPLAPRLFAAFNQLLRPEELGQVLRPASARDLAHHPRSALATALDWIPDGPPAERARRFLLAERVGRLAAAGLALDRHYLPVAIPFAAAPVLRQMHELQLAERRFGRALAQALVRHFPRLAAIPWQRTGMRPGTPWFLAALYRAGWKGLSAAGIGRGPGLVDYGAWWRGPIAPLRAQLLQSPALAGSGILAPDRLAELAAAPPRTPRAVARDGVLMALAITAELLTGQRALPATDPAAGQRSASDPARA
jgi:hypothetical protein